MNIDLVNFRRNEIASCEEVAYSTLPIKDACTLLFFANRSELMAFAQQVRFIFWSYFPVLSLMRINSDVGK